MFNNFSLRKQLNKNKCCRASLLASFPKTHRSEPVERLPCYITQLQWRLQTSQKTRPQVTYIPHSSGWGEITLAQSGCKAASSSCLALHGNCSDWVHTSSVLRQAAPFITWVDTSSQYTPPRTTVLVRHLVDWGFSVSTHGLQFY